MRYLIDTHVLLWWLDASPELSGDVRDLLRTEPEVYVSAVTPWEIAIKHSLGKLPGPPELLDRVRNVQFKPLPITGEHGVYTGHLPWHHHDPFDRLLIAQAQLEELTILTRDTWIPKYDVSILRV